MSEDKVIDERPKRHVHIDLTLGWGEVTVDGIDLSRYVSGIRVNYHVDSGLPVVSLDIPALVLTIDGAADVLAGFVDIETLKQLREFAQ
jgi:hypothetical protein